MSTASGPWSGTSSSNWPQDMRSWGSEASSIQPMLEHALETLEDYGRRNPWNFGLAMLGLGFVLGWKLKFF